jgi:hypothetical protein
VLDPDTPDEPDAPVRFHVPASPVTTSPAAHDTTTAPTASAMSLAATQPTPFRIISSLRAMRPWTTTSFDGASAIRV